MKKLFLVLTCLIAFDVEAKTAYTDYTFEGYTYEKCENTDTYKYEETKLNKFYKKEEINSTYLDDDSKGKFDGYDELDKKEETIYTKSLPQNTEGIEHILSKIAGNTYITKIILSNINFYNIPTLKEIEVYDGDEKIEITIPEYPFLNDNLMDLDSLLSNTVEIELSRSVNLNNLKTKIHHAPSDTFKLTYGIYDNAGNTIHKIYTGFNEQTSVVIFETLSEPEYVEFTTEHKFPNSTKNYYYTYEKTLYRYYNIQKVYYGEPLESLTLEGYEYDPEESITAYKIYKRELIEEPDTEEPVIDYPPSDNIVTEPEPIEPPIEVTSPAEPIDREEMTPEVSLPSTDQNTSKNFTIASKPSVSKTEHTITPIEYETKNETGEKITDEMIKNNEKNKYLTATQEECETIYLINGKHIIIISIIIFLLVIMHTLHKLYVNDRD